MAAAARAGDFVTLGLEGEVFAVPVDYVREILDYRPASKIPEAPAYLLGLIDVRGRPTPVLDLRTKLGLPSKLPDMETRILVLDIAMQDRTLSLALVADRVIEVLTFDAAQIEPRPDIGVRWRSEYIGGVVRRETGFIVIFHLENLLTGAEAALVEATSSEAA